MKRQHATCAIISVGDELTLGQTLDTNSRWISTRLVEMGVVPVEHVTVPDELAAQATAIVRLATSVDLVIVTGGLGPTEDDLTREAVAKAAGDELVEDPIAIAQIETFFGSRGRAMPDNNRRQALRPKSGQCLQNLHGTAPGLWTTLPSGVDLFCVPGPPFEMKNMFEQQVVPRLRPDPLKTVATSALHCVGIGESDLATRLGPLMDRTQNPLVGTTASGGIISCRIRYQGPLSVAEAQESIAAIERQVHELAAPFVFGRNEQSLALVVLDELRKRHATLGVVESCTAGLLASRLVDVPGASSVFQGGLITYSNHLKSLLGHVPPEFFAQGGPGAVSSEAARELAVRGLDVLGVDACLSVTGIAGPGGGIPAGPNGPAKPVGTVFVGLALKESLAQTLGVGPTDVRLFRQSGDRQSIREGSVVAALATLWLNLAQARQTRLLREVPLDFA